MRELTSTAPSKGQEHVCDLEEASGIWPAWGGVRSGGGAGRSLISDTGGITIQDHSQAACAPRLDKSSSLESEVCLKFKAVCLGVISLASISSETPASLSTSHLAPARGLPRSAC